ncbi:TetR/AcrR family transcriptional regulator [Gilvimarinus algae]|uniref:TetR/AcrR family transcriptional regulator n=1 Tax=Gilvimarinus algae TaxID=3058037 RepID=A0ABT8THP3_9GAMM|nr:TetR/AcrR family transcriptional regulator [Gilvimarinus sp. SDUM040014]MDO3383615.1 TetR/AcrR family transcriptional regulator [Gilvimarinus sp. SDUM040014]
MADDKRRAILYATLCLLSERGFHGFSMKQLAERAGVAAGTIYLYFRDKEDLIRQLYQDIISEVARRVFVDHDTSLPLYEQYRRMMLNLWTFHLECPEIMLSKVQFDSMPPDLLFGQRGKEMAVLLDQRDDVLDVFKPMMELYQRGRDSGELKPFSDEMLSALCIDPVCALAREHYLGLLHINEEQLSAVIDATWDAIRWHPQPTVNPV